MIGNQQPIKAGAAYYDLQAKDSGLSAAFARASASLRSFGSAVALAGVKLTALGTALTVPLTSAAKTFATAGMEVYTLAKKLGTSAESMSALGYAAKMTGTSLAALGTSKANWQAFFKAAGGESEVKKLMARARELGLVMSGADVKSARAFQLATTELWATLRGLTITVGSAVAPALTALAKSATNVVARVSEWARANKALIAQAFTIAKSVVIAGTALTIAGTVIAGVGAAVGILGTMFTIAVAAVTALLTPVGLVAAAIGGVAAYFIYTRGVVGSVTAFLSAQFKRLYTDAQESFQGISDALSAGDLKLAAKILWVSLRVEFQRGTNALSDIWSGWKATFFEALADIAPRILDAWASVKTGFVDVVAYLADVWSTFAQKVFEAWNNSVGAMLKAGARFQLWWQGADKQTTKTVLGMIDVATDAKNKIGREDVTADADAREAKHKEEQQKIFEDRDAQGGALPDFAGKAAAARGAGAAAVAGGQQELADLQAQRDQLLADAAAKRKKALGSAPDFGVPSFSDVRQSTAGTFNGALAGQILGGSGGVGEKVDKLTQEQKRHNAIGERALDQFRAQADNIAKGFNKTAEERGGNMQGMGF